MQKRGILLLLVLVIVPCASAMLTENLYSGTILNTQTINITGINFTFIVLSDTNKVYIQWEDSSLSINGYIEGTNETSASVCDEKENLYFCVGAIYFSYTNTTTRLRYYSAPVSVKRIITEVGMSRSIDNSSLVIGQQFTIKAALENKGTIEAKNVEYSDYFPDAFSISLADVKGCAVSSGSIVFKGVLGVNEKKECSYTLTAIKGISYSSKAALSYFNGNKKITESSGEISINVANISLALNAELNKTKTEVGDDVQLLVTLENTNSENDVGLILALEIPSRLEITKKTKDLEKTGNRLNFNGDLMAGQSLNFSVDFKTGYFGDFNIKLDADYTISGFKRKINKELALKVLKPEIEINIDAPEEIEQGLDSRIRIRIVNPYSHLSFDNINIGTANNLNLTDVNKAISKLENGSSFLVLETPFTAPLVVGDAFYYNLTLSYKTEKGQLITTKKSIPIKVTASYESQEQAVATEEKSAETPGKRELIYDEESESFYNLLNSTVIKSMIAAAILLFAFLIIKFRKKLRDQELKLRKEEETKKEDESRPIETVTVKKEEGTGLKTASAQKEGKVEIKKPVEEPKSDEQLIVRYEPPDEELSVPEPPPEEKKKKINET